MAEKQKKVQEALHTEEQLVEMMNLANTASELSAELNVTPGVSFGATVVTIPTVKVPY